MLLFVTFLALATASVSAVNYRQEFVKFMQAHGKTYSNSEFAKRFATFKNNLDFVQSWDAEAKGFEVGINEFSDLENSEFVAIYNGFQGAKATRDGAVHVNSGQSIPASVDWVTAGAVTGIKNQGQCGSCWSFSTTGNLEGVWQISGHTLTGLSEKNLMDCSTAEGNEGCNGGLMDNAFKYVISNKGIDTEASYPYVPQDGKCKYTTANDAMYITGFTNVASGNEADLTDAIATVGPISVAIDASLPSFQSYTKGIYYEPSCSSTQLDHGVLAVGYGQTGSGADQQYYIVKNSWGTSWGQQGYIWMARNRNNNCGIATMASYSTGPTAPSK